ncbi:hypothetical protein G4B88_007038 [Cannabis sativa]|uniref:Retrotransposon Copia-like N-terminal domain-containing protein n=1 Tax=Cannabis sativa TaxID=3483 RepID=A0A7J6FNK7_CANSA|nr:hypothetical protein G4B88_007038 [Cannabis sativa]
MAAPAAADSTATAESSAPVPAPQSAAVPSVSIFQSLAPLTLKLDRGNYTFWKSQVLPALRAHDLEGFVLGTKECPPQFVDNTEVQLVQTTPKAEDTHLVAVAVEEETAVETGQCVNFAIVLVMSYLNAIIVLTSTLFPLVLV